MLKSFPTEVADFEEFLEVISCFIIYFIQALKIMKKFFEDNYYFGDNKPENFLVSF